MIAKVCNTDSYRTETKESIIPNSVLSPIILNLFRAQCKKFLLLGILTYTNTKNIKHAPKRSFNTPSINLLSPRIYSKFAESELCLSNRVFIIDLIRNKVTEVFSEEVISVLIRKPHHHLSNFTLSGDLPIQRSFMQKKVN